ncbi:nuclear pore complex protein An-Nup82 [Histoplasma capsulatum var. duboisii H88]|uniref:Nuclear pore complex protein An-Nup82 n=1 Tax=Ajellomyces capsulatus (strain H88) TaxID=544711 RepID=A0A8A1LGN4_AJEC8|nr:nuclear pore complex protein An-Nup82 [Histoplasma capsulatum var. duboisii H88]
MPKVIDYSPPWLSRPSPGATFFLGSRSAHSSPANRIAKGKKDAGDTREQPYVGPRRALARRGTEVFVVVENQIRWSNLSTLKDEWQTEVRQKREEAERGRETERSRTHEDEHSLEHSANKQASFYRVLTVPVYGQITQLVPSPNGNFLAIITPHTIHVAILPDSSHLSGPDYSPLRLKAFQLGPTTHVIPEAPVVTALWHPLGICDNQSGCLVTVTRDAAVRVWEIDRNSHWSFDRPTVAVDLKKLADGMSMDEDFAPSGFGQNKGFSADFFDMEVSSVCFGGHGYEDEDAWAPMTLWIAMRPGDVYALCPLLPSKWQVPSITISTLTTSVIHKFASVQGDLSELDQEKMYIQQQYDWLTEIDSQEPLPLPEESGLSSMVEVRARPANLSAIPKLQGPFQFNLGEEIDELDLTDILVIAAKADVEDLMSGEDGYALEDNLREGVSATVICLATTTGRVHICLELDGVEGQWLPMTSKGGFTAPVSDPSELLLLESLETVREKYQTPNSWPLFTEDAHSRYNFFITSTNNVTFLSLLSWAERLETELQSPDPAGSGFRIKVLCDGSIALREQIVQVTDQESMTTSINKLPTDHLSSCLVLYDYDLGYLLLTTSTSRVHAVILDSPSSDPLSFTNELSFENDATHQPSLIATRRSAYQPSSAFYSTPPLASFIEDVVPHGHRHTLREPIRLSPSTLDLITAAHRILSAHTSSLERAASDLFRRCERLQGEMQDQLSQLAEIAERINNISNGIGQDRGEGTLNGGGNEARPLNARMVAAESRQRQLVDRYNNIRNKIAKAGGRPMSEKEKGWVSEVDRLSVFLAQAEGKEDTKHAGELGRRMQTAQSLVKSLLAEASRISEETATTANVPSTPGTPGSHQPKIPQRLQRARIADAMNMVERESAVIDAITSRLERLTTSISDAN